MTREFFFPNLIFGSILDLVYNLCISKYEHFYVFGFFFFVFIYKLIHTC
jgi:hypothetical protein